MEGYLEVQDEVSLVMMFYHSNSNPKTVTSGMTEGTMIIEFFVGVTIHKECLETSQEIIPDSSDLLLKVQCHPQVASESENLCIYDLYS